MARLSFSRPASTPTLSSYGGSVGNINYEATNILSVTLLNEATRNQRKNCAGRVSGKRNAADPYRPDKLGDPDSILKCKAWLHLISRYLQDVWKNLKFTIEHLILGR
jgi:hypothetical protein